MIVEGVNFNPEEIKKLSRDEFIEMHISFFWQDREEETRKKMLNEVYDLTNPPKKGKKKPNE